MAFSAGLKLRLSHNEYQYCQSTERIL